MALRAEVEENIADLKVSNPGAMINYLNVLPIWSSTGVEWDKNNIRTTIFSACAAQEITCWDTLIDPWLSYGDTIDGVHPNISGHQKIGTRVKALIE